MKKSIKLALILSVLGALVSTYLLYHHLSIHLGRSLEPSFCSISALFDCDVVARSSYSEVLGVPVASGGMFYFAFFAYLLFRYRNNPNWGVFKATSVLGLVPVIVLLAISLTQIRSICIVCVGSYLIVLLIAATVFRDTEARGVNLNFGGLLRVVFLDKKGRLDLLSPLLLAGLFAVVGGFPAYLLNTHRSSVPTLPFEELMYNRYLSQRVNAGLVVEGDFSLGDPASSITVVAFSDFGCPACALAARTLEKLRNDFPIRIVFKNFPLDQSCNRMIENPFHEFSCQAAAIARCAGRGDGREFWRVHDELFALNQLSAELIAEISTGVDSACISEELVKIRSDVEQGVALNIEGTPTVFLNGRRVPSPSEQNLRELIKRILRETPTA